CACVFEVRKADDALLQLGADGIQEIVEGGIFGTLGRSRGQAINVPQSRKIVLENLDEPVVHVSRHWLESDITNSAADGTIRTRRRCSALLAPTPPHNRRQPRKVLHRQLLPPQL